MKKYIDDIINLYNKSIESELYLFFDKNKYKFFNFNLL